MWGRGSVVGSILSCLKESQMANSRDFGWRNRRNVGEVLLLNSRPGMVRLCVLESLKWSWARWTILVR